MKNSKEFWKMLVCFGRNDILRLENKLPRNKLDDGGKKCRLWNCMVGIKVEIPVMSLPCPVNTGENKRRHIYLSYVSVYRMFKFKITNVRGVS